MARERGLQIGVEGTVMSGTPTVLAGMNLQLFGYGLAWFVCAPKSIPI